MAPQYTLADLRQQVFQGDEYGYLLDYVANGGRAAVLGGVRSNLWLSTPGSLSASDLDNNSMHLLPIFVPRPCAMDGLACEVTIAGGAGCAIRLGLYAAGNDGFPDELLVDAGTVDGTTVARKVVSFASVDLPQGLYYVAAVSQGNPATPPRVRANNTTPYVVPHTADDAVSFSITGFRAANVVGALPAPAPAVTSGANTARVIVRVT